MSKKYDCEKTILAVQQAIIAKPSGSKDLRKQTKKQNRTKNPTILATEKLTSQNSL